MTIFIPWSPEAVRRKEKGAQSRSLNRDKGSCIGTKVHTKLNNLLSTGKSAGISGGLKTP